METNWPTFSETDQHRQLRDAVRTALRSWRRFVIAIDGVDASGKSNLGRYLSWQLGMPVIETDLFIENEAAGLDYRWDHLKGVTSARTSRNRPVIIEGICVLRLLQQVGLSHDYLVWVETPEHEGSGALSNRLASYRQEFAPRERANFVFTRAVDNEGAV